MLDFTGADPYEPMDENAQYNCVYHTTFSGHSLLYRAEVDGIDSSASCDKLRADDVLELKTVKKRQKNWRNPGGPLMKEIGYKNYLVYHDTYLKWWTQCHIVGECSRILTQP